MSYMMRPFKVEAQRHSRSNRVSLYHWNTVTFLAFISRRSESEKCHVCIPMEKAISDLNPSDAVFLPLEGRHKSQVTSF